MKIWNRLDNFLAWIAGDKDADKTMDPRNPREYWLKQIAENGGSGSGYTVTEERTVVIPEQTVTTKPKQEGQPASSSITVSEIIADIPESLVVTYDGVEYTLQAVEQEGTVFYGDEDFGSVPFAIVISSADQKIYTEFSVRNVTIKAESVSKAVTPSEDFEAAVKASGAGGAFVVTVGGTVPEMTYDKTPGEVIAAVNAGQQIVFAIPTQMVDQYDVAGYYRVTAVEKILDESISLSVSIVYSYAMSTGDSSYHGSNYFDVTFSVYTEEINASVKKYTLEGKKKTV